MYVVSSVGLFLWLPGLNIYMKVFFWGFYFRFVLFLSYFFLIYTLVGSLQENPLAVKLLDNRLYIISIVRVWT